MCRPYRGRAPDGIYASVLATVHQQLTQILEQYFATGNPPLYSLVDWAKALRSQAFQYALTPANLQAMAIAAQRHEPKTSHWQYAITELINALRESGQLVKISHLSVDLREDAINQTLQWVVERLSSYDSDRGGFIQWVNYRLGITAQTILGARQSDLNQKLYQGTARYQYQLKRMLKQVRVGWASYWLRLSLKGILPNIPITWHHLLVLIFLLELSGIVYQYPQKANVFLKEAAQILLEVPEGVVSLPDTMTIEDKALEADPDVDLLERLRAYIQTDPKGLFQNHVRKYPNTTFQAIMLGRLDDISWGDLSQRFGVPVPTLSTFFQRQLKKYGPDIRQDLEC